MKSVKGLSRSFVALTLTGAILEFCYGQIIGMPLPTRMNALREVVVVGVLFYKHWYRQKTELTDSDQESSLHKGSLRTITHSIFTFN